MGQEDTHLRDLAGGEEHGPCSYRVRRPCPGLLLVTGESYTYYVPITRLQEPTAPSQILSLQ